MTTGMDHESFRLKNKIEQVKLEVDALDKPMHDIPELISSTNVLRLNEHLLKSITKKDDLLSLYDQYTKSLESLLSTVFEIQTELTAILKEQSSLLSEKKYKSKSKSNKKI